MSDPTCSVDQLCIYGQSKLAGELAIKEAFDLNASGDWINRLDENGPDYQEKFLNISSYAFHGYIITRVISSY